MNIALSGKLASGKSTLAEKLVEEKGYLILSIGSTIKKITNFLIEDPDKINSYLEKKINENERKELLRIIFSEFEEKFAKGKFEKDKKGFYVKNNSYRKLTQFIATTFRERLGEEIWVIFVSKEANELKEKGKKVIIDDLRYKKEKEIFEEYGFKIIRINVSLENQIKRIKSRGDGIISSEQLNHHSETSLDGENFDFSIDSDELSIEEIKNKIYDFLNI